MTEEGPFASGGLKGADGVCLERVRTPDGATMLPFVGANARPDVLFTTDRQVRTDVLHLRAVVHEIPGRAHRA